MVAPMIIGIICATIYGLFELYARRRERIALIEKLSEIKGLGEINGKIDLTFGKPFSFWALRGGCLLVGLGLGIIVGFFLTGNIFHDHFGDPLFRKVTDTILGGSILFFGGIGLLVAFILEMKYFKKTEK